MERSKAGMKKRSPDGLSLPKENTTIINIICFYCIRYWKGQWNLSNKKQNGLEQSKN